MSKVAVTSQMLKWALQRSGRTIEEMILKFPNFDDWLSGQADPTLKQLESFANATHTPFGFLLLEVPPEIKLPIPHFRTLDDKEVHSPSTELHDTIFHIKQRQEWLKEYLEELGCEPLRFVGCFGNRENPEIVAKAIRDTLDLDFDWAKEFSSWESAFDSLKERIESVGIFIFVNGIVGNNTRRKLLVKEFRGFVLVDKIAPVIFINGVDSKSAQMFTVAHELAHIFLGVSASFALGKKLESSSDPTERACNQIAAEFLVPKKELMKIWTHLKNNVDRFEKIAEHFKVSPIVAARRSLDLELVNKDDFFDFYNNYMKELKKMKKSKSGGGHFYHSQNSRVGHKFKGLITSAVKEGKLLYTEAHKLTNLRGHAFLEFTGLNKHRV